jgi:hypothetical protein
MKEVRLAGRTLALFEQILDPAHVLLSPGMTELHNEAAVITMGTLALAQSMTVAEIRKVVEEFVQGVRRAQKAGLDGAGRKTRGGAAGPESARTSKPSSSSGLCTLPGNC